MTLRTNLKNIFLVIFATLILSACSTAKKTGDIAHTAEGNPRKDAEGNPRAKDGDITQEEASRKRSEANRRKDGEHSHTAGGNRKV